ncbi:hypothetical protein SUGI_0585830 [Cryptomeria japonica]|nr:hypothetical protein SUGI_0585830 [Cryptomeria japonica]
MAPSHSNIRNGFLAHRNSKSGRNNTNYHYNIKRNHNSNSLVMFNASHCLSDHPVEVVGRIRDIPNQKERPAFELVEGPNSQETSMRVKTETGYKDFSLDGISMAEKESLTSFYKAYIEDRVYSIRTGGKCTIIMYGPTGTGKSHTMFGSGKEPGIVYRALHCIMDGEGIEDSLIKQRLRVKVSILEIYNEEVFDLISPGAANIGWFKNGGCRAKLEVIGKKVKNATSIYGSEARKITKEVSKVEKKRIVKSTLINERSSRSHCLIIIDVPEVGGRLVLVDMAGSENVDQAGSVGSEAKMQTGKINQGNTALKRVVESIANGDSHVPYRDSKLTMLLQDSFEDDGAKLLMVLCASSDPQDLHKTIGTLEYGAKAKCIVRLPNSPPQKDKTKTMGLDSVMLQTRILAMDEHILKLQVENKLKEQERQTVQRKLEQKEEEVAQLRMKIEELERMKEAAEAQMQLKSEENIRLLRAEFKQKFEEYECKANKSMELGHMRMEKCLLQHQQEVGRLCRRLDEIECEVQNLRSNPLTDSQEDGTENASKEIKIIPETCLVRAKEEDATMSMVSEDVKSYGMPLGSEIQSHNTMNYNICADKCQLNELHGLISNNENASSELLTSRNSDGNNCKDDEDEEEILKCARLIRKGWLPTVYEEEENADEEDKGISDERITPKESKRIHALVGNGYGECHFHEKLQKLESLERYVTDERRARIENIFLLCGNYREIARKKASKKKNEAHQTSEPVPDETEKAVGVQSFTTSPRSVHNSSPLLSQKSIRSIGLDRSTAVSPSARLTPAQLVTLSPSTSPTDLICPKRLVYEDESSGSSESASEDQLKEMIKTDTSYGITSCSALTKIKSIISGSYQDKSWIAPNNCTDDEDKIQSQHHRTCDVYVKWEVSSHEISGSLIGIMKISKDAFLKDLRKMIELDVKRDFIFLTLQDPSGAPVAKESESRLPVTILPVFPNKASGRLASLRLSTQQRTPILDSCCSGSTSLGLPASPTPASDLVQCSSCSPWLSATLNNMSRSSPSTTSAKSIQKGDSPAHDEKMQIVRTVHIRYFSQ